VARLLIIDDDKQLLSIIANYMSSLGHEVHCASEREEAEALLNNVTYSLIITDLSLSNVGVEGLELLKQLSELRPQPPAFVLSAHDSFDHRDAAQACGADLFIPKPVSLDRLGELVCIVAGTP
jgi:DNA-binding response OmpR family regulator